MTAAKQFKGFIDRIEALHAERQAIATDISSVYKEAREARFDVKTMKALIAERQRQQRDPAGFKSAMELLEEYRELLLGTRLALHARASDLPPHDLSTGEIHEPGAPEAAAPVQGGGLADEDSGVPALVINSTSHGSVEGRTIESGDAVLSLPPSTAPAVVPEPPAVWACRESARPDANRTSDPGTSTAGGLSPADLEAMRLPPSLRRIA